jgi:valyl-tRNA synthetase
VVVSRETPASCAKCGAATLVQETDVLDTWFSSGLFPFSTLGWPDKTPDLERYYPNSMMMTGFDIIFFWVARMIVMGLRFAGGAPFPRVFLNGIVRDEHGEKMSKMKGNVVDPLDVCARHGTDAVRFTLVALAAPGTDPSFGEGRLVGYKAFVNKLWNASRFVLMNLEGERAGSYRFEALPLPSRWILGRLHAVSQRVNAAFAEFRFDVAANELYHFVWDEFCDWYVEISKTYLADPGQAPVARRVLVEVLETTLRLLHPIVPFVTEEIWQRLPHEGPSVMVAPYPKGDGAPAAAGLELMAELQQLVVKIRTIRAEYGVDPKRQIQARLVVADPAWRQRLAAESPWMQSVARAQLELLESAPAETARTIKELVGAWDLYVPMAGLFDIVAEKARLGKERLKVQAELEGQRKKLASPNFVERAKPEVVVETRERIAELESRLAKIEETLRELGSE